MANSTGSQQPTKSPQTSLPARTTAAQRKQNADEAMQALVNGMNQRPANAGVKY
jgi:hypothetical protein